MSLNLTQPNPFTSLESDYDMIKIAWGIYAKYICIYIEKIEEKKPPVGGKKWNENSNLLLKR